ncbi:MULTISPECIES: stage III sporulation protein AF [unclassified Mesobacillus]|uniref:stage III sporulation protein AF n=1 Tax=unclassified Mesobacillus TaxID=2675270 RepID=UPI00203B630E|nr:MULTISPECIES: stage III sporulation protein AF [unclassified Mesobacillus]MCM3124315.1 stage III sporulation protein AF [Mesobacillus sp. MER 33]MCM3234975.1 stage III sporulation protein AF [Mesobacillus sp. MER 48]
MLANFFRIFNAVVLWTITSIFLPKQSFKRYLPVTLFCSFLLLTVEMISPIFNWWDVKGGYKYRVFDALAFILGPFFTVNLWVFHFTFGKFSVYAISNLVMDLIFAYIFVPIFQKIGHFKFKNFTSTKIFLLYYSFGLLNYAFQKYFEKPAAKENTPIISEQVSP